MLLEIILIVNTLLIIIVGTYEKGRAYRNWRRKKACYDFDGEERRTICIDGEKRRGVQLTTKKGALHELTAKKGVL